MANSYVTTFHGQILQYTIGHHYHYPYQKTLFRLKEVTGAFIFRFECGHWCTDCVFKDLFDYETGIQVYKDVQLKLF